MNYLPNVISVLLLKVHLHIFFWLCPTLCDFWSAIFEQISKAYSIDILRALKSHALTVRHTHFNQFTRSHATPDISHAEKVIKLTHTQTNTERAEADFSAELATYQPIRK